MKDIVLNFLLKRFLKLVQKNVYGCVLGSDSIEMNVIMYENYSKLELIKLTK